MTLTPNARRAALALAILTLGALGMQFINSSRENPTEGAWGVVWILIRYFTILTNTMILVSFTRMAITGRSLGADLLAALTLWIAIVGVVYHLLLARFYDNHGLAWWANHGVHTAVPIAVALWWVVFAHKHGLHWRHPLWWLAWPSLYLVYALTRGQFDGVYPYFFIDVPTLGWAGVAGYSTGLCVAFGIAGYGIIGLARLLRGQDKPG